jgi:UDP-N-acetylmuramate--alanine ligase
MPEKVHLMGSCGSGMSALALWYSSLGLEVTGCDRDPGQGCEALVEAGIPISKGHDPSHVEEADRVVFSAALPRSHPELARAAELGKPVLRRSEALEELTRGTILLAVAGAHGKSTTTAMTGWILQEAGLDPTVMVGASIPGWTGGFRPGGSITVVEADEYDRSFLRLKPSSAAVTSFADEHLECYGSPEALSMAFGVFLEMTVPGGTVIVPSGLEHLARWAARIGRRVLVTGPGGHLECRRTGSSGWDQTFVVEGVEGLLRQPGAHNLRNACTAIALASTVGVSTRCSVAALESFPGAARRLERIGMLGRAIAISDYAHHPDEMTAAMEGAAALTRGGRVGIVFQPHLYSRTSAQAEYMGLALAAAAWSLVLPVYAAREEPIQGVTGELVAEAARRAGADCLACSTEELPRLLDLRDADAVVFMGAGSIDSVARKLIAGSQG